MNIESQENNNTMTEHHPTTLLHILDKFSVPCANQIETGSVFFAFQTYSVQNSAHVGINV